MGANIATHCRPVHLAFVLCISVCLAVGRCSSGAGAQNPRFQGESQPLFPPAFAAPSATSAGKCACLADGVRPSDTLNSLQGVKVARIEINNPSVEDTDALLPLPASEKPTNHSTSTKVRQSVQMLYNTGRFAEIQVGGATQTRRARSFLRSQFARIISSGPSWWKALPAHPQ